ncbi:MAG: aspartyl/asparaginyl beta-hydroxylase domain-containing protein [Candidatus Eremiobacteraeota bacterium]|nr:aspartyl/asparaginyl beta-hydroxylase domain-containing protein [Candidatus Eremiobacteraeota bacterium]
MSLEDWLEQTHTNPNLTRLSSTEVDLGSRPAIHLPFLGSCPRSDIAFYLDLLEASSPCILEEYRRARNQLRRHPGSRARGRGWNSLMLYKNNHRQDGTRLCPRTTAVLERLPLAGSLALAYFSVLEPDTVVKPHCGLTNVRVRVHLGLEVPAGCSMTVGREKLGWQEGRCLWFDDGLLHWVENRGKAPRVVLLLDLWHPRLSQPERDHLDRLGRLLFEQRPRMKPD